MQQPLHIDTLSALVARACLGFDQLATLSRNCPGPIARCLLDVCSALRHAHCECRREYSSRAALAAGSPCGHESASGCCGPSSPDGCSHWPRPPRQRRGRSRASRAPPSKSVARAWAASSHGTHRTFSSVVWRFWETSSPVLCQGCCHSSSLCCALHGMGSRSVARAREAAEPQDRGSAHDRADVRRSAFNGRSDPALARALNGARGVRAARGWRLRCKLRASDARHEGLASSA